MSTICQRRRKLETNGDSFADQYNVKSTVLSLPPANAVKPNIILSAPELLSACDGLVVDATGTTGSGGRAWTRFLWGAEISYDRGATYYNASDISSYLNEAGAIGTPVHVPRDLFNSSAVYSISLFVRNFLGRQATKAVKIQVSSAVDIPYVALLSPTSLTIYAADELTLTAVGQLPSCAATDR